jgi:TldD protein
VKDLARLALDTAASRGASYADVRAIEFTREDIQVKNGEVGGLDLSDSVGLGVRVLVGLAWGFSATDDLTKAGVERCAAEAVASGRASASLAHEDVRLAPEPAHRAVWSSTCAIDPFGVPLEQKLDLLFRIDTEMRAVRGVKNAESFLSFQRKRQFYLSTEGSDIEQTLTRSGGGFSSTAVSSDDVQRRSFPQSDGFHQSLGYEFIESIPFVENARRIAEESVALLTAPQCPAGDHDIILEGSQLALQIHESVGHPTELDRVLGMEANYAGTSFLTLDKKGKLAFGSKIVNLVADATLPHGLATFGFDDDGVEAQPWPIVRDGLFEGYLTPGAGAPRSDPRAAGASVRRLAPHPHDPDGEPEPHAGRAGSLRICSRTPTARSSWRRTAAGASTSSGTTFSSRPSWRGRSGRARGPGS